MTEFKGVIHECVHCRTQTSGKYCSDCNTVEKRKDQDEANRKNFEDNKLLPYVCEKCNQK